MKISRCVGLVENPWTIQLSYDELITLTRSLVTASVLSGKNPLYVDALQQLRAGRRAFEDLEDYDNK